MTRSTCWVDTTRTTRPGSTPSAPTPGQRCTTAVSNTAPMWVKTRIENQFYTDMDLLLPPSWIWICIHFTFYCQDGACTILYESRTKTRRLILVGGYSDNAQYNRFKFVSIYLNPSIYIHICYINITTGWTPTPSGPAWLTLSPTSGRNSLHFPLKLKVTDKLNLKAWRISRSVHDILTCLPLINVSLREELDEGSGQVHANREAVWVRGLHGGRLLHQTRSLHPQLVAVEPRELEVWGQRSLHVPTSRGRGLCPDTRRRRHHSEVPVELMMYKLSLSILIDINKFLI